jgi:hypothetical protein
MLPLLNVAEEIPMPRTQSEGIANGHWERSEPRSAWLLLLARMGVAELRMLSDWARTTSEESEPRDSEPRADNATAH